MSLLGTSFTQLQAAAKRAGVEPSLVLDSTPYFAAGDVDRIRAALEQKTPRRREPATYRESPMSSFATNEINRGLKEGKSAAV